MKRNERWTFDDEIRSVEYTTHLPERGEASNGKSFSRSQAAISAEEQFMDTLDSLECQVPECPNNGVLIHHMAYNSPEHHQMKDFMWMCEPHHDLHSTNPEAFIIPFCNCSSECWNAQKKLRDVARSRARKVYKDAGRSYAFDWVTGCRPGETEEYKFHNYLKKHGNYKLVKDARTLFGNLGDEWRKKRKKA